MSIEEETTTVTPPDNQLKTEKKQKKNKKDKKKPKMSEDDTSASPVVEAAPVATEESKPEKKKKKKEKKAKTSSSETEGETNGAIEQSSTEESAAVKSEKKKRKRTEEEAEEAEAAVEKNKKKKKKEKGGEAGDEKKRKRDEDVEVAGGVKAEEDTKEEKKKKKKKEGKGEDDKSKTGAGVKAEEDGTTTTSDKKKKNKKEKSKKSATGDAESNAGAKDQWSYTQHPSLTALPESTITSFLTTNQINITNPDSSTTSTLRPILEFSQASFPAALQTALSTFAKPTPIQSVTWPIILSGRDLVGIAATGSGKTIAFGVPALIHIRNRIASGAATKGKPQVLVLSPTRELAMQIQETFETFGAPLSLSSVCLYGGVDKYSQKRALQKGVNVVVATPGRLLDLVEEGECDVSDVSFLVLDEADRMLDFGFEEAIKRIMAKLTRSSGRQTVMFSATWPLAIQKLSTQYLTHPTKITVGSTDLSAATTITQRVEVINPREKESRLLQLLKQYHDRKNRILIFALYKKEAARLESMLRGQGYKVAGIHGDLGQHQRTSALESFKSGKCPLLIATDVAARGIDIPNVEYVINVTFPLTVEDYCHRIGRTGRAGKTGISHTFFTVEEKGKSGELINVLKQAGQDVPAELFKFGTTVKKKVDPNYGVFAKDVDMSVKGTKTTFNFDD
ncbi:RNA-dependent ATPase [Borealophlyctis nickersoniae]|nr:RNA-dependent ATPase [Borealophlyctis nickersoniae]